MKVPTILLALAIVGVVLAAESARSEPMIVMTGCDTTSVNGIVYPRVSFRVNNTSPLEKIICGIILVPQTNGAETDTCHAVKVIPPKGWVTGMRTSDGGPVWLSDTGGEVCVFPHESLDGFQVVLSRSNCCFDAYFNNAVIEPFAYEEVCLPCDLPSPARASTWGGLKAHYR